MNKKCYKCGKKIDGKEYCWKRLEFGMFSFSPICNRCAMLEKMEGSYGR